MRGCCSGCLGVITALVVAGALLVGGLVAIVASSGIVTVPVLSDLLFKSLPEPDEGYALPRDATDERRDRLSEIGDELRDFFQYGIEPATGAFELSEQDVADMLAELIVGLEENTFLRSVAVDLTPDSVDAFLVIDLEAAARQADVSASVGERPLVLGVTTVEIETNVTFADDVLNVDVKHIQIGHAPAFVGRILAFIVDIPVDSSVSRLPVDTGIERLVIGEGNVQLEFKGIFE